MTRPIMQCGHVANGRMGPEDLPVCVSCYGIKEGADVPIDEEPSLAARVATCSLGCPSRRPSSTSLAFFEWRGPGSPYATEVCTCGFYKSVHDPEQRPAMGARFPDHEFVARGPHEFDSYYCGCRGWD